MLRVSPCVRTRQTAEIINNYLRIENVKEDTLIIERQYGLYDTLHYSERAKYKDAFEFNNWMHDNNVDFYSKFPLGESPFDTFVRARLFMQYLEKEKYENIFIVSHGMFLKCFQMAYFNYSPEWYQKHYYMDNCAIKLIDENIDCDYIYKSDKPRDEEIDI